MEGTEAMGDNNVLYVKVMTDEQMEVLRKQISVYATICEGLVEMHKAVTAQQDSLAGMRLGNLYCDPLTMPGAHKITARQRWTPTPMQLQILERLFEQGNGTPSKQKIKDITLELSQHGQISETNVYNWFQNRRARSKRKQVVSQANNTESEADGDEDSPSGDKEKKPKSEKSQTSIYMNDETADFDQDTNNRVGTGVYMMPNDNNSTLSGSSAQLSFYDNILSNPRYAGMEHYMGKMSSPGSFSHLQF